MLPPSARHNKSSENPKSIGVQCPPQAWAGGGMYCENSHAELVSGIYHKLKKGVV